MVNEVFKSGNQMILKENICHRGMIRGGRPPVICFHEAEQRSTPPGNMLTGLVFPSCSSVNVNY
jgi:hypothetical protein